MKSNHLPELTIHLDEVPCNCMIGILPRERVEAQTVFVSAELRGDFSAVALDGNLANGVDYSALQKDYLTLLKLGRFRLLETATYALCQWSLWRFSAISQITIKISKPQALGGLGVPTLTCCLSRPRSTKAAKAAPDAIILSPDLIAHASAPTGPSNGFLAVQEISMAQNLTIYCQTQSS